MVDRVYKSDLPAKRRALEKLRKDFSNLDSKTNWTTLRIDPLLKHLDSLERLLKSREFSGESSRLRRGVPMFHSDLVYLRLNVLELEKLLRIEKRASQRRAKRT